MAETASTVIRDALQEILVQASEQPITASEGQDAMRLLNRMMAAWKSDGLDLSYTDVDSLNDAITVADGAIDAIVLNLAIKLAPQYDRPVSQTLYTNAKNAMNAVRKIAVTITETEFPSTLPYGSGNESLGYNYSNFYAGVTE
jgi:hypothetical protein